MVLKKNSKGFFSPILIEIKPRKKFKEEIRQEIRTGMNISEGTIFNTKRTQNDKKKIRKKIKLLLRNFSELIIYLILIQSL